MKRMREAAIGRVAVSLDGSAWMVAPFGERSSQRGAGERIARARFADGCRDLDEVVWLDARGGLREHHIRGRSPQRCRLDRGEARMARVQRNMPTL